MICPVCESEKTELFAEVNPNGLIGCFCHICKKGYVTKDPDSGWSHIELTPEAIQDLQAMHGVCIPEVIWNIALAEREFEGLGF